MTNVDKAIEISNAPADYQTEFDSKTMIRLQRYNAAMLMAEWKDEQVKQEMIEKAVEWMKDHAYDYSFMGDTCIEEFKQAMKGE